MFYRRKVRRLVHQPANLCFLHKRTATPLILNLKGTGGIGDNMIYRIVKDLVAKAAVRLARASSESRVGSASVRPSACV